MCKQRKVDVLCLQETHRGEMGSRPKIQNMQLIAEIPHEKYGSAVFANTSLTVNSVQVSNSLNVEIITIELANCTVTSVYKPPGLDFKFQETKNFNSQKIRFVLGDFNSHSTSWGYEKTNENGKGVEDWAERNNLSLIHDAKLPHSFNSRAWRKGYNPDICFASTSLSDCCVKLVLQPIPKTQHRPIGLEVSAAIKTQEIPFRRRFNFKKAEWSKFSESLDSAVEGLPADPQNYESFVNKVKECSRKHIPRGCRKHYIAGLTEELKEITERYNQLYNTNPFAEDTIELGHSLMRLLSETRQKKWIETLEKMDMTHSSKMAWNLIKKLNGEPKATGTIGNVTANQVANQLLLNSKSGRNISRPRIQRIPCEENLLGAPFQVEDFEAALKNMKNGKAAGLDDLCIEQIKHFGEKTKLWLVNMFNRCRETYCLPKLWRKSKVIALLKPGKDPDNPSSYRPISLLCHLFKLYERLILTRIGPSIESKLIPQQAGFRPGKCCTSQVLNLTEHIEVGFQRKLVTGVAFVDLSAAFDTVNHRLLLAKIYHYYRDFNLVKVVESLLTNRRFYVCLMNKKSRWRTQKNGLPQGSVLSPILFNIYTNDQPILPHAKHFLYADDLAIAVQDSDFPKVEEQLEQALSTMAAYYKRNSLKPNPSKTQICAFHLRSREARRKLHVVWEGHTLEHSDHPKYLGVTLDRSLTYKQQCVSTSAKVHTRNNILKKLRCSKWGASPSVLRTSAKALCFSTAEYASPIWNHSTHSKKVDVALNETCRIVTGCLKPTPLHLLHKAAGFAEPKTRRATHAYNERFKQAFDERHVMFGIPEPPPNRLKSRAPFLTRTSVEPPDWYPVSEEDPPGSQADWTTWRVLNQIRTGVAPVKANMCRWGLSTDDRCDCGERQTMDHLYACTKCHFSTTVDDLWRGENFQDFVQHWAQHF